MNILVNCNLYNVYPGDFTSGKLASSETHPTTDETEQTVGIRSREDTNGKKSPEHLQQHPNPHTSTTVANSKHGRHL